MRVSQRSCLFGGVALVAGATVLLEIALTRLYSAIYGHHLAFLAISLSLFGVGLGGVLLYLAPSLARPPALFSRLAKLSAGASGATVAALILLLYLKPIQDFEPRSLLTLAGVYLASSAPFVLAGVVIAAAIRHAVREIARLYLVDLAAAAAGGLAAIAALRAGAPRAALIVAILFAVGGLLFWLGTRAPAAEGGRGVLFPGEGRGAGAVVATFVIGTSVLLAGDIGAPWLKLPNLRWVTMDKVEFQTWNELALITVDRPRGGMAWMRLDGSAATAILDAKTVPPLHPDEMAYVLHKGEGPVLVVGAGGGRDIRAALKAGQKEIHAAEINPAIVNKVMRGRYAAFSGNLFDKPEVRVVIADGRSYARRSPVPFRNVVISLVDTWAAASVGALALTENSLYTVEGFKDFLDRLTPEGTLIVNRWDAEFDRLLGLGVASLRAVGAEDPKKHLFACGSDRSTALLIKRTPLTRAEINALRNHCRKNKFTEAFAPDQPRTEVRRHLVALADPRAADPGSGVDLSPPTDDRPFFFFTLPARRLPEVLRDVRTLKAEQAGLLTITALLAVSAVLAAVFLLGPLLLRRAPVARAPDRGPRLRALLFFLCLGAGFVLVEIALVQHFVLLLGHPVYALSTVLVLLLLSAGVGSLLTVRIAPEDAARAAAGRALLLVVALALAAVGLGRLLGWGLDLPFAARLGLAAAVLVPVGLLMGAQAPLGVKIVATRAPALLPWCWGLNGIASVVSIAAGTLTAMLFGYSAVLLAAGFSYLLAAALVPPAASVAAR